MVQEDESTREVQTTNEQAGATNVQRQTVRESHSVSGRTTAKQAVWLIADIIAVLLLVRVVLQLLGANVGNGFVDAIYGVSGFFAAPFFGMFSYTPTYGKSYLEIGTIVAILVYMLIGWGIVQLLSLGQRDIDA